MVPQVWSDLCQRLAPQVSSTRRPMAPRRSVPQDQRTDTLSMAGSGSGWRRIGYSGPEPEGQEGSQEVLPQALKGTAICPRVIITDKLKSYSAAKAEVMPGVEHLQQKYQNNRAENSHQPTRLRERVMRRFKSSGHAQRFLSAFGLITSHFRVGRHHYSAQGYREVMKSRFAEWREAICVEAILN